MRWARGAPPVRRKASVGANAKRAGFSRLGQPAFGPMRRRVPGVRRLPRTQVRGWGRHAARGGGEEGFEVAGRPSARATTASPLSARHRPSKPRCSGSELGMDGWRETGEREQRSDAAARASRTRRDVLRNTTTATATLLVLLPLHTGGHGV
ncbi:unnamed protein product [Lampetra fluviatilis]